MRFLHTESSNGWGGQEMRILRESEGMRARGHEIILAIARGGGLIEPAKRLGFTVYECDFTKTAAPKTILQLLRIIRKHRIDLVNTHSSLDAWLGGIAGKIAKKRVLRTRHLSTPVQKGINSLLLYNKLADFVVTTSSSAIGPIVSQSRISASRCCCVATGVDPEEVKVVPESSEAFRKSLGLTDLDCLVGTACFVRSWKGIKDFMKAAHLLRDIAQLKWVIIGGGYVDDYRAFAKDLELEGILYFTGHLENPYAAMNALDIFTLLSTANEGISQAALQAAYFQKPLITTTTGGLPEICLQGKTGILVPPHSPEKVASAVLELFDDPIFRKELGMYARHLVETKFTLKHTLDQMESIYHQLIPS